MIHTTNPIEALNRQLRKAIKTKGHFPNEEAARKLIYLSITSATPKWTRVVRPEMIERYTNGIVRPAAIAKLPDRKLEHPRRRRRGQSPPRYYGLGLIGE